MQQQIIRITEESESHPPLPTMKARVRLLGFLSENTEKNNKTKQNLKKNYVAIIKGILGG